MVQKKEHYYGKCVLFLSMVQIIFGLVCIILQIVLIINPTVLNLIGQGIWAGIFFVIAGILGIVSSQKKNRCTITAFLVMAIISAIVAFLGLMGLSASSWAYYASIHTVQSRVQYYNGNEGPRSEVNAQTGSLSVQALVILNAVLTVIALVQGILAIVSSGYACHGLCCGGNKRQGHVVGQVQYVPGPNGQQQAVVIPMNQQGGYNPHVQQNYDLPPKY